MREALDESARLIRRHVLRTVEGAILAGEELIRARDMLPYGAWGAWLRVEFGWSDRHAYNLIRVAEHFRTATPETVLALGSNVDLGALYLAAAPSASDLVREAVVAKAAAGERVTKAHVRGRLDEERLERLKREARAEQDNLLVSYRELRVAIRDGHPCPAEAVAALLAEERSDDARRRLATRLFNLNLAASGVSP